MSGEGPGNHDAGYPVNVEAMKATNDLLARGLWDCMVAAGADVSGYCRGGPTDPFWTGTPDEALDAGFEQWRRMRSHAQMAAHAVRAVRELRADYDEAAW